MAPLPTDQRPGHSTGPRTAEGKTRSSQNAYKHGSCSTKLLLPGEDPQEYSDLVKMWIDDYDSSTETGIALATETATAHWLLHRQRRRYDEAEYFIADQQPDAMQWTPEQHKHLQLFMRYLAAAERTFHRALAALEAFRSRRIRESQAIQRAGHRTAELHFKQQRFDLNANAALSGKNPGINTQLGQTPPPAHDQNRFAGPGFCRPGFTAGVLTEGHAIP